MMLRSSHFRYYAVVIIICGLAWSACLADTANPDAGGLIPDPDTIIKKILGVDEMAKNVCLIDSHEMVNAADLPGRLVVISADRQVPSDLLRYSFRKPGAKITTQVNPPTTPIQVTRLESLQARSGSLFNWFGAGMSKEDIVELRTIPLPATSISVDDLDEESITERFSMVPRDIRKGLGIITSVIPYEVYASICKKTTKKAEAGVWYIQLGKNTYFRQSDELRKYYLVVVYTPLRFYDDIGIIPIVKATSFDPETWQPDRPVKNRAEAFSLWLKEKPDIPQPGGEFFIEREIGWIDTSEDVPPKTEGANQDGATDSSSCITTVMPE